MSSWIYVVLRPVWRLMPDQYGQLMVETYVPGDEVGEWAWRGVYGSLGRVVKRRRR